MSSKPFVRLCPCNPRLGYKCQGYVYRGHVFRGGERPTWYEVDQDLARELAPMRQNQADQLSPALFQVCDADEKVAIEKREQALHLQRLGAVAQTVGLPKEFQAPATESLVTPAAPMAPLPSGSVREVPDSITGGALTREDVGGRGAAIPSTRSGARRSAKGKTGAGLPPAPEAAPPAAEGGAVTTDDVARSDEQA